MQNIKPEKLEREKKDEFIRSKPDRVIDTYPDALLELFLIRNPKFRFSKDYSSEFENFKQTLPESVKTGEWFYFPWNDSVIHYPPEQEYFELRTARNKNLITREEQDKFYGSTVGVAGLSVGSHCSLTIVMMGGARHIKLADPDVISISNLNRIRYGASTIGINKAVVAARIIYETNPYAEVEVYDEGVNEKNLDEFFSGLNIFIEEADSLELKIRAREKSKQLSIPLIMATDNGDGVIVDVERYDLDSNLELFNGALGIISIDELKNFTPSDMPKLATKVAGPKLIVPRMQQSLLEVGRTLYSWPQLGSAATFSGVIVAYLARKIIIGDKILSGKYDINLDSILDGSYNEEKQIKERNGITQNFLKILGLQ